MIKRRTEEQIKQILETIDGHMANGIGRQKAVKMVGLPIGSYYTYMRKRGRSDEIGEQNGRSRTVKKPEVMQFTMPESKDENLLATIDHLLSIVNLLIKDKRPQWEVTK